MLTKPNHAAGEVDHVFPSFLPGDRAVLFTILAARAENAQVAVLDLASGQYKTLIRGGQSRQVHATPATWSMWRGDRCRRFGSTLDACR